MHACDDDICYVEESTLYAEKLFVHGVSVEIHLFARGAMALVWVALPCRIQRSQTAFEHKGYFLRKS